jgi:hypothetical protein
LTLLSGKKKKKKKELGAFEAAAIVVALSNEARLIMIQIHSFYSH